MLKGLSPLLTADLLHALRAMGHGDELAIVDANFPAASVGRRLIEVPGAGSAEVLAAVLAVLPVDTFESPAAVTMEVVEDAAAVPPPVREFSQVFAAAGLGAVAIGHVDRRAFYARARNAFAVVRTGELRPYGNVLVVKGVVNAAP